MKSFTYDDSKKFINDGNPDFKSLVTENCLYIDKTRYIEVLENIGNYNIVLRPKRFGKSLFASLLMYYYGFEYADEFDTLFDGLYIKEHKTEYANTYNVLKFDFSGISANRNDLRQSFTHKVRVYLESFIHFHKLNFTLESELKSVNDLLHAFLARYREETERKILLLIDEYDHFANVVLGDDFDYFKDITGESGFVRSFYEVFKEFAGTVIGRVYITGVTPITLDSLASGFNFVINRSLDPQLNKIMGFSQEEINWMLDYYNIDPVHKDVIKEYYNGYLFSNEGNDSDRVYNSTLVFYYLAKVARTGTPPVDFIDARISSSPGMVRELIDLYKDTETKRKLLKTIQEKGDVSARVVLKFDNNSFMATSQDMLSMLFYLGFLTVKETINNTSLLTIPNRTVEELYSRLYLGYISDLLLPDVAQIDDFVTKMLHKGDTKPFAEFLHRNLKRLNDHDFDHMNEQGIKNFVVAYLRLYQNIHMETELDVEGGRIDIAILPAILVKFSHYYVIEIKYISAGKNTLSERRKKRNEALAQLNKYKTSQIIIDSEKVAAVHKLYMQVIKDMVTIEEIL